LRYNLAQIGPKVNTYDHVYYVFIAASKHW